MQINPIKLLLDKYWYLDLKIIEEYRKESEIHKICDEIEKSINEIRKCLDELKLLLNKVERRGSDEDHERLDRVRG